jgi:hypothetical protein
MSDQDEGQDPPKDECEDHGLILVDFPQDQHVPYAIDKDIGGGLYILLKKA